MKRWLSLISVLMLIVLISGCTQISSTGGVPCVWVYKTNGNYSNLRIGSLWFNLDKNKTSVSVMSTTPSEIEGSFLQLNDGYKARKGTCNVEGAMATVFFTEDFNNQPNVEDYVIMAPFSELWICSEESGTSTFNTLNEEVQEKYNNIINNNQFAEYCTLVDTSETIIPQKHEWDYAPNQ